MTWWQWAFTILGITGVGWLLKAPERLKVGWRKLKYIFTYDRLETKIRELEDMLIEQVKKNDTFIGRQTPEGYVYYEKVAEDGDTSIKYCANCRKPMDEIREYRNGKFILIDCRCPDRNGCGRRFGVYYETHENEVVKE